VLSHVIGRHMRTPAQDGVDVCAHDRASHFHGCASVVIGLHRSFNGLDLLFVLLDDVEDGALPCRCAVVHPATSLRAARAMTTQFSQCICGPYVLLIAFATFSTIVIRSILS